MKRWTVPDFLAFATLCLGASAMAAPFIWMLSTSLKLPADQFTGNIIPPAVTLDNYREIFRIMPFHNELWNSAKIAALTTLGQLATCSMAAFIFTVVKFPFRSTLFLVLLLTLMIPAQVTYIPQFIIFKYLGLIGTQAPLYLPGFLGGAFGIFLMRQYFQTIPLEIAEAARIEGASLWRIYWSIYLPLAKPALAALGVFSFMFSWNDLFGALIYLPSDVETTTLPVGLALFNYQYHGKWTLLMAASLFSVFPVIAVFFIAQKRFVEGIAMSGFK